MNTQSLDKLILRIAKEDSSRLGKWSNEQIIDFAHSLLDELLAGEALVPVGVVEAGIGTMRKVNWHGGLLPEAGVVLYRI